MKKFGALLVILLGWVVPSHAQFSSEDEASVIITGGNTNVKTYSLKSINQYKWKKNTLTLKGSYTYGETDDVTSIEKWDVFLGYERAFNDKLSLYAAELIEAHRYAGYRRRYNSDAGLKWTYYKTEQTNAFFEGGYRYTVEEKTDRSIEYDHDSKGRLYTSIEHKFKDYLTGSFWMEYLPNFTDGNDYLVNFSPALLVRLSKIFSIKMAYLWNYDNEPAPGNRRHDYTYTMGLIAKF